MADYRAGIYQTVASPKQFLWAPFELAIINILLAVAVMMLAIAVLGITPFIAMVPLIFGHAALIVAGAKNPHLFYIIQCSGRYRSRQSNIAPVSKGVKFVP